MQEGYLIAVDEFCANYGIEVSFISSLQETGLIEVTTIQETGFIDASQLSHLERLVQFHYDLEINLEGIETITYLLQRINSLQEEIIALKNRLRLYDSRE